MLSLSSVKFIYLQLTLKVSYICTFKAIKLDVQIRPVFTASVKIMLIHNLYTCTLVFMFNTAVLIFIIKCSST